MSLDPQLQALRDQRERDGAAPLYRMSLAQARVADLASIRAGGGEPEPVGEIRDLTIPGPGGELPLRLYRPARGAPRGVLVYFFGGGWVLGTIDTADGVSRSLANAAGALVAVPGYRLAPEHPFPAAVDDCYAAVQWIAGHAADIGAPARIVVGGDSAGGNLAASVALLARDGGPELAGQLLVYPNTDQLAEDESMRAADDPYLFNRHSVAWYRQHYLTGPGDAASPLASPLRAESLAGLPPAWSSPPSTTRCATRARPTPGGWPPRGSPWSSAGIRAWLTGSSRCSAPSTPAGGRSGKRRRSCGPGSGRPGREPARRRPVARRVRPGEPGSGRRRVHRDTRRHRAVDLGTEGDPAGHAGQRQPVQHAGPDGAARG